MKAYTDIWKSGDLRIRMYWDFESDHGKGYLIGTEYSDHFNRQELINLGFIKE